MAREPSIAYGTLAAEASNTPMPSISLSLRFSEVRFEFRKYRYLGLINGELFVAAHTAYLDLALEGCEAPETEWKFNEPAEHTTEIVERMTSGNRKERSTERSAAFSGNYTAASSAVGATVTDSTANKRQHSRGASFEKERTVTRKHHLIVPVGSADAPRWLIENGLTDNYGGPSPLIGPVLNRARFCNLKLKTDSASIELNLVIPSYGLSMRDDTGLFRTVNKRTIARIRLQRRYCRAVTLDKLSFTGA